MAIKGEQTLKSIFHSTISRGGFDLAAMLQRIDEYHIAGKITDADRDELQAAARREASPGMDVTAEIQRLWAAVGGLRKAVSDLAGEPEGGDAPAFVQPTGAHDAYFAGARVTYNGAVYECVAPGGVACVWSPDVMPDHWRAC